MRRRELITLLGGAGHVAALRRAQERPKRLRIGTVSLNRRASAHGWHSNSGCVNWATSRGKISSSNTSTHPTVLIGSMRRRGTGSAQCGHHCPGKPHHPEIGHERDEHLADRHHRDQFDPVALGVVASIARPGGNITGFYVRRPETVEKQIGLLAETFPGRTRLGVIWDAVSGEAFPAAERTAIALRWDSSR